MADQGALFANPKDVRFWNDLYGGGDEEMNGRSVATPAPLSALSIVENPEEDPGARGPPFLPPRCHTNPLPHP
jgi:myotubularin-related protein 6/7/8